MGKESLSSKLKYKLFYSNVTLFENVTAKGEIFNFSFKDVFGLNSEISCDRSTNIEVLNEDFTCKKKLQYQLFEDDIFKGEIVGMSDPLSNVNYHNFELICQIKSVENNKFDINLSLEGDNKPDLDYLVLEDYNHAFREELLHKGKFYHILNSDIILDTKIIDEFIDLWDWNQLAENNKVVWSQKNIFNQFKENGDGSIWKSVSKNAPIENIKLCINSYKEYWDWRLLTNRFDNEFIFNSVHNFPWDFEELSTKEIDFVIQLLELESLRNKNWDWEYLSRMLPDKFIVEKNINTLPWDYYLLTTNKFEVFKTVFNTDIERQLKKPWNWKYISEEININYLYQNISKSFPNMSFGILY